jgi:hypothetical protein
MRRPALLLACLIAVSCTAASAEVRADLCGDLGHLAATVDDLAGYGPAVRVAVVRGSLEKMDPTFGNLSRSRLADPPVLDRLLQAHVVYRDLLVGVGDDETFATLGPAAPVAATEFRAAFRAAVADLRCPG